MMGRGLSLCRRRMGGSGSILGLSGMSYWVAGQETDSQNLTQLGSSGAGDAQFGSTSGADSNDPTSLSWSGTDYLWFPGTAGNTLSVARPVASVDVVITYDDDSTDSSLTAQTDDPLVFGGTDVLFADLNIKSIQLKNNSGGAEVGLFQAVNATQSGETDSYSNVWSIARSASGLKSTLVTRPVIVFNSAASTYLEVADHADLDMGATDDFTVWVYGRHYGTAPPVNYATWAGKAINPGYELRNNFNQIKLSAEIVSSGSASVVADSNYTSGGSQMVALLRDATADTIGVYSNEVIKTATDNTTASLANASAFTVGVRAGGSQPHDIEVWAAGILKGTALTATQLASLKTELDTLLGGRTGE